MEILKIQKILHDNEQQVALYKTDCQKKMKFNKKITTSEVTLLIVN